MNRMKKNLFKVLLWGLIIDVAFFVLVFFVNIPTFDEDLDPGVIKHYKMQPPELDNNALALLYGFNAPTDKDFVALGKRKMSAILSKGLRANFPLSFAIGMT